MSSSAPAPAHLSTPVLLLMSVATGLCAGSNYFNQPLIRSIAEGLQVSDATAAITVTLAQVSYGIGLLLLVPLGDKLERRNLTVGLMLLASIGLFASGFATNFGMLVFGTLMTGLFSVAAQTLVPMAATLSDPARSGRAVGFIMSGLLTGILAARSVAGLLSGIGNWSTVYRVAAVLMLVLAAALWWNLPRSRHPAPASYLHVLKSMGTLLVRHPRLRWRSLLGGMAFASVSCLFSTMALLLSGPEHGLDDVQIGLVGLVGVAGAFMANVAGRMADRGRAQHTSVVMSILLVVSWFALWRGETSLVWFLIGMLAIDIALQGVHISNQNIIYGLDPQSRGRLTAVYMTSYFAGAAVGSAIGAAAWQAWGWTGTCAAGLLIGIATGAVLWLDQRGVERGTRQAIAH